MTTQVTREVPVEDLERLVDATNAAIHPLIKFSEDMEEMKKARDEEREAKLYTILSIVKRYL